MKRGGRPEDKRLPSAMISPHTNTDSGANIIPTEVMPSVANRKALKNKSLVRACPERSAEPNMLRLGNQQFHPDTVVHLFQASRPDIVQQEIPNRRMGLLRRVENGRATGGSVKLIR